MSAKAHQFQTGGPRPLVVKLDVATRVFLMDSVNWSAYGGGHSFRPREGGYFTRTPTVVNARRGGTWSVVIEAPLRRPVHHEISA